MSHFTVGATVRRVASKAAWTWCVLAAGLLAAPWLHLPLAPLPVPAALLTTLTLLLHLLAALCLVFRSAAARSTVLFWVAGAFAVRGVSLLASLALATMPGLADRGMGMLSPLVIWGTLAARLVSYLLLAGAMLRRDQLRAATRAVTSGSVDLIELLIRGSLALIFMSMVALVIVVGFSHTALGLFDVAFGVPLSTAGTVMAVVMMAVAVFCAGGACWLAYRDQVIPDWLAAAVVALMVSSAYGLFGAEPGTVGHYLAHVWMTLPPLFVCIMMGAPLFRPSAERSALSTAKQATAHPPSTLQDSAYTDTAERDSLTALYTWKRFTSTISQQIARDPNVRDTLAVMLIDVQGLHRWNATEGYLFGDTLIGIAADAVRYSVRVEAGRYPDFAGRVGGTVAVCLSDIGDNGLVSVERRIRQALTAQLDSHAAHAAGTANLAAVKETLLGAPPSAYNRVGYRITVVRWPKNRSNDDARAWLAHAMASAKPSRAVPG